MAATWRKNRLLSAFWSSYSTHTGGQHWLATPILDEGKYRALIMYQQAACWPVEEALLTQHTGPILLEAGEGEALELTIGILSSTLPYLPWSHPPGESMSEKLWFQNQMSWTMDGSVSIPCQIFCSYFFPKSQQRRWPILWYHRGTFSEQQLHLRNVFKYYIMSVRLSEHATYQLTRRFIGW